MTTMTTITIILMGRYTADVVAGRELTAGTTEIEMGAGIVAEMASSPTGTVGRE